MADDSNDKPNTLAGLSKDSVVPAVGSPEQKKGNAAAVEAANPGGVEEFANPDARLAAALPTSLDHQGNERISGVIGDNWAMPPSRLSDDEIAAAEAREAQFAKDREIRLSGGLAAQDSDLKSDESSAANATQGSGGSS